MSFALGVLLVVLVFWLAGSASAVLTDDLDLISIAHASVLGTGAYTYGILTREGLSAVPSAVGALTACAVLGLAVTFLSRRLVGEDFALATFAFQLVWFTVVSNLDALTGGPLGISGIPGFDVSALPLGEVEPVTVIAAAAVVGAGWVSSGMSQGAFCTGLATYRRSRELSYGLGLPVNTMLTKVGLLYGVGVGGAGVLYAQHLSFIDPTLFGTWISVEVLAVALFGTSRLGHWGVGLGAFVLVGVPELLRLTGLGASRANGLKMLLGGVAVVLVGLRSLGSGE